MSNTSDYRPIVNDDEGKCCEELVSIQHRNTQRQTATAVLRYMLLGLFLMFSSFFIGRYVQKKEMEVGWLVPPGSTIETFVYDDRFSAPPGEDSDNQWASIFPRGRGYVQHPQESPEPTCVAVYHQLHCLDAIRRGYWALVNGSGEGHEHSGPHHIRHCIDYLRQSLMCHADSNPEHIKFDLGGVDGFGTQKTCRDYSRLTEWADRWRTHNETTIV